MATPKRVKQNESVSDDPSLGHFLGVWSHYWFLIMIKYCLLNKLAIYTLYTRTQIKIREVVWVVSFQMVFSVNLPAINTFFPTVSFIDKQQRKPSKIRQLSIVSKRVWNAFSDFVRFVYCRSVSFLIAKALCGPKSKIPLRNCIKWRWKIFYNLIRLIRFCAIAYTTHIPYSQYNNFGFIWLCACICIISYSKQFGRIKRKSTRIRS